MRFDRARWIPRANSVLRSHGEHFLQPAAVAIRMAALVALQAGVFSPPRTLPTRRTV